MAANTLQTKILKIKDYRQTFLFPINVSHVIIRNNSATNTEINFDNDSNTDFFTLVPLERFPVVEVRGGINKIKYKGGNGSLELLMWG